MRLILCLLLFTLLTGMQLASVSAADRKIVDATGRTVVITDTSRVVAIGGSVTEIIYALGEQNKIVARDSTSVYPREANSKKNIGYMRALSAEGVLSVKPTLILAIDGAGPPEVMKVLEKASIPILMVPHKYTREGVLEKIQFVSSALGVSEKGKKLIKKVKEEFKVLDKVTSNIKKRKKVIFILSMRGGRVLASGNDTAASGIIALAGAENALTQMNGYKPVADEAIIQSAPEAVLMMDRQGGHAVKDKDLFNSASFKLTPAAKEGKIIRFSGIYLLGFGPRTASAAKDLAIKLYGKDIVEQEKEKE